MMPGAMDGLQLLDFIKSDAKLKNIIVGMVTARGQTADDIDARRRGADAYFIKPFSPREVVAWVDSKLQ
jgi:DNA-binding response OmpR family regulator